MPQVPLSAIHNYILEYVVSHGGRALDYGCGSGEIVQAARAAGVDMVGAEVFYEASDSAEVVRRKGLLGTAVFEIRGGHLPFGDATFDVVVSNQVFEHVDDLDEVLTEIVRVLKPGGTLLALFPSLSTWREGHCGIPLVHRLRPSLRYRYLWLWRSLGFGYFREGKSRSEYAAYWVNWLERFTHYRSMRSLREVFSRYFSEPTALEAKYMAYRLRRRGNRRAAAVVSLPPVRPLSRYLCRRLAGLVIELRTPQDGTPSADVSNGQVDE